MGAPFLSCKGNGASNRLEILKVFAKSMHNLLLREGRAENDDHNPLVIANLSAAAAPVNLGDAVTHAVTMTPVHGVLLAR